VFGGIAIVGRFAALVQNDAYIYNALLLIIAAFGVSAKRIMRFFVVLNVPMLIATIVASKNGVIDNWIEIGRDRESLGYTYTTTPVMIFAYVCFSYIILRKGKIGLFEYVILNLINLWLFLRTNSRFAYLIVSIALLFSLVYEKIQNLIIRAINAGGKQIVVLFPCICFIFIGLLSLKYNPKSYFFWKLNKLLSNRLKQCNYSLKLFGLVPFGQPINFITTARQTADNPATYVDPAYLQTLVRYGYISLLVLLLISSYLIFRSYKEKRYYILLAFLIVLVFGLSEQQLFWFEYDALLLLTFADWKDLPVANESYTMNCNWQTQGLKIVDTKVNK
jgi:hypothetical protein